MQPAGSPPIKFATVPAWPERQKRLKPAKLDPTAAPFQRDSAATVARMGWARPLNLVSALGQPDPGALALDLVMDQQPDGGWKESPQAKASDLDSSVLNHTALTTLLRRRPPCDPATRTQLEGCLGKSWAKLTGKTPKDGEALLQPLPRKVLARVSQAPASLHEALLGRSVEVRIDPDKVLARAVAEVEQGIQGQAPLPQAPPPSRFGLKTLAGIGLAAGAAVLAGLNPGAAALAAVPLGQFVAGLASGWMVSSFNESFFHDKQLHASKETLEVAKKLGPKMNAIVEENWFGHTVVHHYRTFMKDFVTQFDEKTNPRESLVKVLKEKGREDMIDKEFGSSTGWKGYLGFQAVALPANAASLLLASGLGAGPAFALGFALPTAIYPLFSKTYHRYVHMTAKDAFEKAPAPIRMLLPTDFHRFMVRHHFVHHDVPEVNFNLMLGADWLRGKAKKATIAQEESMRQLKLMF